MTDEKKINDHYPLHSHLLLQPMNIVIFVGELLLRVDGDHVFMVLSEKSGQIWRESDDLIILAIEKNMFGRSCAFILQASSSYSSYPTVLLR